MKKVIIIATLCFVSAVFSGCVVVEKEEIDKVGNVLAAIKLRSEVDFPEPVNMDMEWKTEKGVLKMAGRGFSIIDPDPEMNAMMRNVLGFFNGYGFSRDEMNTSREGNDIRTWGYTEEGVACIVRYLPVTETTHDPNDFFVEVRCGLMENGKLIPTEEHELMTLFDDIVLKTNINFSNPKSVSFSWMVDAGETIKTIGVKGKEIFASGVERNFDVSQKYFEKNGFVMDTYNIADGTVTGLEGYKKGMLACTVLSQTTGLDEEEMPTEESKMNVTISCGHLDPKAIPVISKEILIKRLFVEKYGKSESDVRVEITIDEDSFARGMVSFGEEGTEGGIFLVAKVNNAWELVFDGNGSIPCGKLIEMNFPSDMMSDCAS